MSANPPAEYPWIIMLNEADYNNKTMDKEIMHEMEDWVMNLKEAREALIEWETNPSNKENKVFYEARLKFLRDELSNLAGARREGWKEGYEEEIKLGRLAVKQAAALEMLKAGYSIDLIAKITKLDNKEVEDIRKNL